MTNVTMLRHDECAARLPDAAANAPLPLRERKNYTIYFNNLVSIARSRLPMPAVKIMLRLRNLCDEWLKNRAKKYVDMGMAPPAKAPRLSLSRQAKSARGK